MAATLSAEMQAVLAGLPGWPGAANVRVELLSRGLNNRTLRVRFAGQDLVVRQALPQGPAVKLSWRRELQLLSAAAAAGIAPPLRYCDAAKGISVAEHLDGVRPWTAQDMQQPRNLDRLAQRLLTLHQLPVQLPRYQALSIASRYLSLAPDFGAARGAELQRLAAEFEAGQGLCVPCHNDLVASNILDDGRLWLIDFEYAAAADAVLDLAGAAALNGLARGARRRLLSAYYGPRGPDPEQFERVCRLVLLMALAWGHALAAAPSLRDRSPFLRHLEKLLSLFPAAAGGSG